jgi:hypothetical protein
MQYMERERNRVYLKGQSHEKVVEIILRGVKWSGVKFCKSANYAGEMLQCYAVRKLKVDAARC